MNIEEIYDKIAEQGERPVWISIVPKERLSRN
jgi:hypothetical protein